MEWKQSPAPGSTAEALCGISNPSDSVGASLMCRNWFGPWALGWAVTFPLSCWRLLPCPHPPIPLRSGNPTTLSFPDAELNSQFQRECIDNPWPQNLLVAANFESLCPCYQPSRFLLISEPSHVPHPLATSAAS